MTYGGEAMERAEMRARLEREAQGSARGLGVAMWLGIAVGVAAWLCTGCAMTQQAAHVVGEGLGVPLVRTQVQP